MEFNVRGAVQGGRLERVLAGQGKNSSKVSLSGGIQPKFLVYVYGPKEQQFRNRCRELGLFQLECVQRGGTTFSQRWACWEVCGLPEQLAELLPAEPPSWAYRKFDNYVENCMGGIRPPRRGTGSGEKPKPPRQAERENRRELARNGRYVHAADFETLERAAGPNAKQRKEASAYARELQRELMERHLAAIFAETIPWDDLFQNWGSGI